MPKYTSYSAFLGAVKPAVDKAVENKRLISFVCLPTTGGDWHLLQHLDPPGIGDPADLGEAVGSSFGHHTLPDIIQAAIADGNVVVYYVLSSAKNKRTGPGPKGVAEIHVYTYDPTVDGEVTRTTWSRA